LNSVETGLVLIEVLVNSCCGF